MLGLCWFEVLVLFEIFRDKQILTRDREIIQNTAERKAENNEHNGKNRFEANSTV